MAMNLELKAKHFKDTTFFNHPCAIEKALPGCEENVWECSIDGVTYSHEFYGAAMFLEDKLRAVSMQPEEVVRVIKIKGL